MGNPILFCVKEKMKSTICTSCASFLCIMLVMLKLHCLCKMPILCQKEETPPVLALGALKEREAKGEWKVRDAAALQSVGFRQRNCISAAVLNIFWESPPNSCNLCISKRELLLFWASKKSQCKRKTLIYYTGLLPLNKQTKKLDHIESKQSFGEIVSDLTRNFNSGITRILSSLMPYTPESLSAQN